MRALPSTRLFALALATSAILAGAGPNGCGPVAPTEPLDPDPKEKCRAALCDLFCEMGNAVDENGCPICACNPPPLCQADSDCASGQRCDTSVCRSGCENAPPGTACPAVCYGECVTGGPTDCDPNAPNACGEGFACTCWRDGSSGFSADPETAPGAPLPPSGCTCEPIEPPPPPPPACDPAQADACGEGFACVCAAEACDAAPCTEEGCFNPPPTTTCSCQPIDVPETCDPNNPVCENGGECVCALGDRAAPPCDPSAPDCGVTPPPPPNCYCVPPPPPTGCGTDPNAPVCGENQDCVCSASGAACDPDDASCTEPAPPPPPSCACVDR